MAARLASTYKNAAQRKEELRMKRVQKEVENASLELMSCSRVYAEAREKYEKEHAKFRELDEAVSRLAKQTAAAAVAPDAVPPHSAQAMLTATSRRDLQRSVTERECRLLNEAERDCARAELALHKLRHGVKQLRDRGQAQAQAEGLVSQRRVRNEEHAANRFHARRQQGVERLQSAQLSHANVQASRVDATRRCHARAARRVKSVRQQQASVQQQLRDRQGEEHLRRAQAMLELKRNTDKAMSELQGANERASLRKRKEADVQRAEFDKILAEGGNPYEVFRQRRLKAQAAQQRHRLKEKVKQSEMNIAERMLAHDDYSRKKDKLEKRDREYELSYRKALGRHEHEERVRKYMQAKTIGGADNLDPTGRTFRVEPSQVTVIKDHGFGLGRSAKLRPDIVRMVASKPGNESVVADPMWVPTPVSQSPRSGKTGGKRRGETADDGVLVGEYPPAPPAPTGGDFSRIEASEAEQAAAGGGDGMAKSAAKSQGSRGGRASRKFPQRPLSVLEQKARDKAFARMRSSRTKKQIVWGKEFRGRAFLPKPERIEFKDFEPGKEMVLRITLTNVSYSFNTFKILDLPDDIKDFFTVTYQKPGRMSAGMSCAVTIRFDPKLNQDIDAALPVQAETGMIAVPLCCYTKKAVPQVSTRILDFGEVVMGESCTRVLKVSNAGALPANFSLSAIEDGRGNADTVAEDIEDGMEWGCPLQFTGSGVVPRYAHTKIEFTFAPMAPGTLDRTMELRFVAADAGAAGSNLAPVRLAVRGVGVKVPIYAEQKVLDLQCCVYDKLYRAKVILRNRGAVAFKVAMKVPKLLRGFVDFHPKLGFVQARGSTSHDDTSAAGMVNQQDGTFVIQTRFEPRAGLLERVARFNAEHVDLAEGVINVPIEVDVLDQVLPVIFHLRAKLTPSDILFSVFGGPFLPVPTVNFGPCYTCQSIKVPLAMKNTSALPQKYGFVSLKKQVDVQPNDGFGTLLPFETVTRNVIFSPQAATEQHFALSCKTSLNRTFTLQCTGRGVEPLVRFSHSTLQLGAVSAGDRAYASFFVSNCTKSQQTFEFCVPQPHASCLKLSPLVGSLAPNDTRRIEVEFSPRIEPGSSRDENTHLAVVEISGGPPPTEQPRAGKDRHRSKMKNIPETQGSVVYSEQTGGNNLSEQSVGQISKASEPWSRHASWKIPCFVKSGSVETDADRQSQSSNPPLFIEIRTTTALREVATDRRRLRFGQIAVGQSKVLLLRVKNVGATYSRLRCTGLNSMMPFSIVNALRPLEANGGSCTLQLKFMPTQQRKYCETIWFHTDTGSVETTLTGEGVSPSLRMEPSNGYLDFGHVLMGEMAQKKLLLRNASLFPLHFNVVLKKHMEANFNHVNVFTCTPSEGVIGADGQQDIAITFFADHCREQAYQAIFDVEVPNQEERQCVTLCGRCSDRQFFVAGAALRSTSKNSFALPPAMARPQRRRRIVLTFPECGMERHLTIGSIDCAKSSAGTFDIEFNQSDAASSSLFSAEPMKGSAPATITFTFVGGGDADGGRSSGQWVEELILCNLKGGYVSPGSSPEELIEVVLRGKQGTTM